MFEMNVIIEILFIYYLDHQIITKRRLEIDNFQCSQFHEGVVQQLRGQEWGEGGGLWMSTWTNILKKGIEESWQMTMKSFITVHKR